MQKTAVSVPGKVHLMGEHAVVYGKPAILAAISFRLSVTIEPQKNTALTHESVHIVSTEPIDHAKRAVLFLINQLQVKKYAPFTITISSDIPAGYHLGSSAAVAVGLSGALMYYFKKLWNPVRINELAYEIEKFQHGTPSGGDNTTVTMGGFIWFRKELEFLKSIWQLPFKPHLSLNHFFLIDTGRPKETTGEMVTMVRERVKQTPEDMYKLFDQNEQQVKRITVALKHGEEDTLLDAIRIGEKTLEGMGVVSKNVIPFIRKVEQAGGAAKILGGGGVSDGVGFLLAYHHKPDSIEMLCKQYGFLIRHVTLGEDGVKLEKLNR